jgi:hypothetical protein
MNSRRSYECKLHVHVFTVNQLHEMLTKLTKALGYELEYDLEGIDSGAADYSWWVSRFIEGEDGKPLKHTRQFEMLVEQVMMDRKTGKDRK